MSGLLIIAFEDATGGFELEAHLRDIRREQRLEAQDITVVTRDEGGEVHLHEHENVPLMQTLGGAVWGLVIGAAFLMPGPGAVAGAAIGGLTGQMRDPGVDSDFLLELAEALKPGGSALCIWVRNFEDDALLAAIRKFPKPGHLIQSPLDEETEVRLRMEVEARGQRA